MSSPAQRRLMRDLKKLQEDPSSSGVTAAPNEDNLMLWEAIIFGPENTPWEGGTFKLSMEFTEEYPNKAPKVKFITKMFHPNVYADGGICIDILQSQWSAIYDVSAILTSLQVNDQPKGKMSLLCDPNPDSPANAEAAKLYKEDRKEYIQRVKKVVEESALQEF